MEITFKREVNETVLLTLPVFIKTKESSPNIHEYLAVLDNQNMYYILKLPDYIAITNSIPNNDKISKFLKLGELVTEEEFMDAYAEARRLTDLSITLIAR